MLFSEKLDRLMFRRGLTQTSLGGKLGISHRAVGKWLAGDSRPRAELAQRLAAELNIDFDTLYDDQRPLPTLPPMPVPVAPLSPAEQEAFDKKSLQDFTEEDWKILATYYPKDARELAASVQQIEQGAKVVSAVKAQVAEQLRVMLAGIAKILPPPSDAVETSKKIHTKTSALKKKLSPPGQSSEVTG